MLAARLGADRVTAALGPSRTLGVASVCAAVGYAVVAVAPAVPVAIAGFGLIGAGVAVFYPTMVTLAGALPGAVAPAMAFARSGFLIGPPMIGGIAEAANLRWAMAAVCLLALVVGGLSRVAVPPDR